MVIITRGLGIGLLVSTTIQHNNFAMLVAGIVLLAVSFKTGVGE